MGFMNGYIAGSSAKYITSKKRGRLFWNIFFSFIIGVILLAMCRFVYTVVAERSTYESKEVFCEYSDETLITEGSSYQIPKSEKQETGIWNLVQAVDKGEHVTLTISKVSGELLEIKHLDKTVFKKRITPLAPTIVFSFLLVFPMMGWCIFMLIVTNIKHPNKAIDRLQRKYLLRIYK